MGSCISLTTMQPELQTSILYHLSCVDLRKFRLVDKKFHTLVKGIFQNFKPYYPIYQKLKEIPSFFAVKKDYNGPGDPIPKPLTEIFFGCYIYGNLQEKEKIHNCTLTTNLEQLLSSSSKKFDYQFIISVKIEKVYKSITQDLSITSNNLYNYINVFFTHIKSIHLEGFQGANNDLLWLQRCINFSNCFFEKQPRPKIIEVSYYPTNYEYEWLPVVKIKTTELPRSIKVNKLPFYK